MKKRTKIILCVLLALAVVGAAALGIIYKLYKDQNSTILAIKDKLKIQICDIRIGKLKDENSGITAGSLIYEDSGKKIITTDKGQRLIHYASGYYADFPAGASFDLDMSPHYVKVHSGAGDLTEFGAPFTATVSREYSSDGDVRAYTAWCIDRFLLDEQYRQANRITLLQEKEDRGSYDIFSVKLEDMSENPDGYTYVNFYTNTKIYYRLTFKYNAEDFSKVSEEIDSILTSFTYFRPSGSDSFASDLHEKTFKNNTDTNNSLSDGAKQLYSQIKNSDDIFWGLFTKNIYDEGINETIPSYEKNLDYKFSVVLSYIHYGDEFPTEYAEKLWADGKIMQLTYQATTSNNEDLFGHTPQLDIYRGLCDDEIRTLARAAAAFGKPFLFRLGNEMNSDWTSYSGVVNMCDPELYIAVWQRIYNIFQEEGANNIIWIYNPNDRAFPPCNWNSYLAYWPGADYVHMIGLTGYNNGTYYKKQNNEVWRSFKDIYDPIQKEYEPFFSDYPWVITEFASSSIGGNKAAWITDMFEDINLYKNIKIAVWFDYADFDPAYENVISRPYWLCETEEITAAVKEGLSHHPGKKWDVIQ